MSVCGGTFDHFHKGHKEFLKFAFLKSYKIIIGITSNRYIKKNKIQDGIELFNVRKKNLTDYLSKEKFSDRAEIIEIDDVFGPTLSKKIPAQAIVVSPDTRKNAEVINEYRKIKKLPMLKIITCPFSVAEDKKPISSKRIRKGQINRDGRLYIKQSWLENRLMLPKNLRAKLNNPFDVLIKDFKKYTIKHKIDLSKSVTVGDYISNFFLSESLRPKISAVDFRIERKIIFSDLKEIGFSGKEKVFKISCPAGCLTPELFKSIKHIFDIVDGNKNLVLKIDGEEDLSVLPFLLYSPLGFSIFYGQPGKGVVVIKVKESVKEKAYFYVKNFKIAS